MANEIRIKRRAAGGQPGAPSSLLNAELAFNENSDILYIGEGLSGSGVEAATILEIAGPGAFVTRATTQTISGDKTFTGDVDLTADFKIDGDKVDATAEEINYLVGTTSLVQDQIDANDTQLANLTTLSGVPVNSTNLGTFTGIFAPVLNNTTDKAAIQALADELEDGAGSLTADVGIADFQNGTVSVLGGTSISTAASGTQLDINLDATGVVAGNYGLAASVPSYTVNAQGQLTASANVLIDIVHTQVSDFDAGVQANTLNSLTVPDGVVSMNGHRITDCALPVDDNDVAIKKYVDEVVQGLDVKASCRAATTQALPSVTYDNDGAQTGSLQSFDSLTTTTAFNTSGGITTFDSLTTTTPFNTSGGIATFTLGSTLSAFPADQATVPAAATTGGATITVATDANGDVTGVTLVGTGAGYNPTDVLTFNEVGGGTGSVQITVDTVNSPTSATATATTGAAVLVVQIDANGDATSAAISAAGVGYEIGDVVTFNENLGGGGVCTVEVTGTTFDGSASAVATQGGAVITCVVNDSGTVTNATVASGGSGYEIGDTLTFNEVGGPGVVTLDVTVIGNTEPGQGATLTANQNGVLTVDGVTLAQYERVLIKDQGAGAAYQNGIYLLTTVGDASTPFVLTRAIDCDTANEIHPGIFTFIEEGSTNSDQGFIMITAFPIVIGVTPLIWEHFSGAGQVTAGAGMVKTGNQLDVVTASSDRIVVNAHDIDLATTGIAAGTYNGLTVDVYGRSSAFTQPTTLAGYSIVDAQPLNQGLTDISAIYTGGSGWSADSFLFSNASGVLAEATVTPYARSILDDADATAARATLGLGDMAVQNGSNVTITGGTINGIVIDGGTY